MKKIINFIQEILDKLKINHIDEYATQCAYFTILAFIPLIMLILTLTKYVGIDQYTLFFIIERILPSNTLNNIVLDIVKEVYSKSVGTITISAIFVLWSAGRGFFALCKGLSFVYGIEDSKRFVYFRLRAMILTIIFIIFIILTLLLLVFSNNINMLLKERFNIFSAVINTIVKSKVLISIVSLFTIFTLMYKFIPKHKQKIKDQIPGAIFSAVACNAVSLFYSLYIEIFRGFSILYGSLTTVVLAMMWIYACMYSILLGATINNMILNYRIKKNS